MKKILIISFLALLIAQWSFAADFAPTVMTLTSPAEIEYQFDGSDLSIPFTVTGTPAALWLVINTHGQKDNIIGVRNGHLGWHYVNKIDTTVYISGKYERSTGESTIVWGGKDQDGNTVQEGIYDYYLWAYDNQTPRQLACEFIMIAHQWDSQYTYVYEVGDDGLPLAKPLLMGSNCWWSGAELIDDQPWRDHGIHFKWELGSNPIDTASLQTTMCAMYQPLSQLDWGAENYAYLDFSYGGAIFDPHDYDYFYHCCTNVKGFVDTMFKWNFVTDGEAVRDEDWLGWDNLTWDNQGEKIGMWSQKPSLLTDGEYIYINSPGLHQKETEWNKLRCVSFDGEVIFEKMMHDWYMPDDPNPHGYINASFHQMDFQGPNLLGLGAHIACLLQLIDTTRLVQDPDDETDMLVWENRNGDYFLDRAYYPNVEPQWYCLVDDKTAGMLNNNVEFDKNGFCIVGTSYFGLTSFVLLTQDGSGVSNCSFADDTVGDDVNSTLGGRIIDSGSNFDGYYMDAAITQDMEPIGTNGAVNQRNTNFVAFDSAHGIITNEPVTVEEEIQAAFAVDQNTPNPFNPSTSIRFTIPEAGNVSIDIYNVAGQKIDTLVNDFMGAGKHSIVWDAHGFSAGIYFYTVKSGDFSRTMKMTLLK